MATRYLSAGLTGVVGSSVANALSTSLDVPAYKNGSIYYQEYRRGHVVDDLKATGRQTDRDKSSTLPRSRNLHGNNRV